MVNDEQKEKVVFKYYLNLFFFKNMFKNPSNEEKKNQTTTYLLKRLTL